MRLGLVLSLLLASLSLSAAPPAARPYHLVLEASPAAVFPYLGRFGNVELHVYRSGVRAEALWLNGFSRNGAQAITVVNPLGRMYVDMNLADIAPTLQKLAGAAGQAERAAAAKLGAVTKGTVGGKPATRHRLVYGPDAYIDVWTTGEVPENAQMKRIMVELVRGVSPGSAQAASRIGGMPILVELNFRRFKKVRLLTVKQLTFDPDPEDEQDALELGALYMKASLLEKLWE
jgi:hypothetical protein